MINKEKIMANGIDVSECEYHRKCILPDNIGCKIDDMLCCDNPNCHYKQLQRKISECEKKSWEIGNLGYKIKNQRKEINERLEQIKTLNNKCKKYGLALYAIEGILNDNCEDTCGEGGNLDICSVDDCPNMKMYTIIRKAKDGK